MLKTNLRQSIFIDALPTKVWKVLTCADYISQYLFEGDIHCQWIEGSSLTLTTETDGRTETVHKGNIMQVVPGMLLKYNLREDDATGSSNTTYELIPAEDGVELKIYCEGFEDSDEEYSIRQQQIKILLQKIKWLAEYS